MNAKIITVWGAAGSGKTTTAVNLALSLAARNYMVGLISSKLYYGELQGLLGCRVENNQGLCPALSAGETKNLFVQAGQSSLFFLSPSNDLDAMLMTSVSAAAVKELYEDARMRFDYLVVDGSEEINNPVSSIALANSEQVILLHHPSVKGCAWYRAMENLIDMLRLKDKLLHVINGYDRSCDKAAYIKNASIIPDYELDYIDTAKSYENLGTPIYTQRSRQTGGYRKVIDKITSWAALS